jgi:hypothetical protein
MKTLLIILLIISTSCSQNLNLNGVDLKKPKENPRMSQKEHNAMTIGGFFSIALCLYWYNPHKK